MIDFELLRYTYYVLHVLCFVYSLEQTKHKVTSALADDFDTRRAVNAINELIRICNVEFYTEARYKVGVSSQPLATGALSSTGYKCIYVYLFVFDKTWCVLGMY